MSGAVTFTIEGNWAAFKYPLGKSTPARVQVRMVGDDGVTFRPVEVPIPSELTPEVYRIAREVVPGRILERGNGGRVTITVTIEGD